MLKSFDGGLSPSSKPLAIPVAAETSPFSKANRQFFQPAILHSYLIDGAAQRPVDVDEGAEEGYVEGVHLHQPIDGVEQFPLDGGHHRVQVAQVGADEGHHVGAGVEKRRVRHDVADVVERLDRLDSHTLSLLEHELARLAKVRHRVARLDHVLVADEDNQPRTEEDVHGLDDVQAHPDGQQSATP